MKFNLVLKNVQYLDVKERQFKKGDVAISNGKIANIGINLSGESEKDCSNKFLVPGFIDGHIHLESSVISPEDFAKIVSTHGTTAVITDPHEIANVCGIDGIKWMMQKTKNLPIDVFFMVSSCVPATPFDESAYTIDSKGVEECFNMDNYKDVVMFVTDDKHPEELYQEGHIDSIIRKAIKLGVAPEDAYTTASYNAAKYFKLANIGSIEVGKNADLVLLSDEKNCVIEEVYKNGEIIDEEKINNWPSNNVDNGLDKKVRNSVNMNEVSSKDFECKGIKKKIIGLVPNQITTIDAGEIDDYDVKNDIIKIVVIESHKGTMHTGIAYLKSLGLKEGAIGTTVAHDSHYAIIAGTNDDDIALVANEIRKMKGGKIVVKNGEVVESLPLPIANLMTDEPYFEVVEKMRNLKNVVDISNKDVDPFMNLSFVSLAVIGDIRLLPGGVFDVKGWEFVE